MRSRPRPTRSSTTRRRRTATSTRAPLPIVVKADGLAAGKGVVVAATRDEAHAAVETMLGDESPAGSRVVIEEFLEGEEASFMVVCDGRSVLALATSQDHKRLGDGDARPEHRRHGRVLAGAGGHAERASRA